MYTSEALSTPPNSRPAKTEPNCNCGFQTRPPAKAGHSPPMAVSCGISKVFCTLSRPLLRYQLRILGQFTHLLICTQQHPLGHTTPAPERSRMFRDPLASQWPCHLAIPLQSSRNGWLSLTTATAGSTITDTTLHSFLPLGWDWPCLPVEMTSFPMLPLPTFCWWLTCQGIASCCRSKVGLGSGAAGPCAKSRVNAWRAAKMSS